jgi:hypothetical protein
MKSGVPTLLERAASAVPGRHDPFIGARRLAAGLPMYGLLAALAMISPMTTNAAVVGSTYHAIAPVRLLDTRVGNGVTGPLAANTPVTFQITGLGGIPGSANAVTANVAVVNPTASWAVYVGPVATASPTTSTINFTRTQTVANGATVALGAGGTLSATYMALAGNTTDLVLDVTGYFTPDSTGDTYHALAPARILDTRVALGLAAKLTANTPVTFQVTGQGGVPTNATAVTGNVTVTNSTNSWAVYMGPIATATPTTSTVNFKTRQTKANNLTVALGAGGTLSATYMSTAGNTTDLILDVTGYYTADTTGSTFVSLTPARVLDTRYGTGLTGKLVANTPVTFQVTGQGGVPSVASAVTGNITVVNSTFSWAVFVGPNSVVSPTTSSVNFSSGTTVGNGITVALSAAGTLSATYLSTAGNTTDLIFDVTGYFP